MEFGNTIPLFFITTCCIVVIPIAGFTFLAILKDKQLTKNILFTVISAGVLSFIFPILQLILALILTRRNCGCETSIEFTPEVVEGMLLSAVQFGAFLIYPGIAVGFIFALWVVLPITFGVRFFKKEKAAHQGNSQSEDFDQPKSNDQ